MTVNSRLSGFYKLSPEARVQTLLASSGVAAEDVSSLVPKDQQLVTLADRMIENAIGILPIPLGIAANFQVNGKDYLVPMATEEPSVIAAASHAASIARIKGGFQTSSTAPIMISQVQVVGVADPEGARMRLLEHRDPLLELANRQDPLLVQLGGGAKDIETRVVQAEGTKYVVLHLVVDVRDAMGANAVNTMAEAIAPVVAELAGGRVRLRILSNKADRRLARVRAIFSADALGGPDVVEGIIDAYRFAAADPYRAATHNKGIMNGVSAVVLATGNDTRAVEAGAHSHACRQGSYTSLSHYEADANGDLVGTMEIPLAVGLVGGATKSHPAARSAVKLLGVRSAQELAQVIVSVGLAQNLGALKALATEGIQRGHMSLHAKNIAVDAGATADEISAVVRQIVAERRVRLDRAREVLAELRTSKL